nr:zinc finger protein 550 isoform X2 [Manis javanica]
MSLGHRRGKKVNLCQGPAFPHRCTWSPERRSQVLKENFKTHNTVCPLVPLGSSEITRCRKHNREIWVLPLESVPCLSFPGASPHLCQLFPGLQTFISYKGERSPAWPDAGEKLHYPVCTERATSQERGRSGPVGRGGISGVARRKRLRRGARFLHSGAEFSAAGRSEQGGTAGRPHLRLRGFWVGSLSPRAPPCGPARHRSDGGALGPGAGHPVPKPELTHLLERGQQLWPVRRDLLARSTSPGDRAQLGTRDLQVLSEGGLLPGSLEPGSAGGSCLGQAGDQEGLVEVQKGEPRPGTDVRKEASPGEVRPEDGSSGAGDCLYSRVSQDRVSQGSDLRECDPGGQGKGTGIHGASNVYKCRQCGRGFTRKWYLARHQRVHTGMKPYACDVCGKAFSQSSTLTRHCLIHSGNKPYRCPECGKAFRRRSYLAQHEPVHTGEKPYACGHCGKAFSHRSTFIRHNRTHSGEKPFECAQCGKSFGDRAHLLQHSVTHTGEKPCECSQCGKAFRCSSELAQHQRTHTGERPYTCGQCGKAFHRSTYLTQHAVVHTAEAPHQCPACGKAFKRRSHLLQHQRVHP